MPPNMACAPYSCVSLLFSYVIDKSYGYTDNTKTHRVNDSTIYDLASVSKVAGTLPGLMLAYDRSLFELDSPAE